MNVSNNTTGRIIRKLLSYIQLTVGIKILIGFIWVISLFITMARPEIMSALTDKGLVKSNFNVIVFWSVMLFLLFLLEYGSNLFQISVFVRIGNQFTYNLYHAAFVKLMKIPFYRLQGRNSAELLNTVNSDISMVSLLVDQNYLMLTNCLFQAMGGVAGLFLLDYRMALVVLLLIPVKQIVVICMAKRKKKMSEEAIDERRKFNEWFGNQINGITEIKLWNLYDKKENEFKLQYKKIPILINKMALWDGMEETAGRLIATLLELLVYLGCGYLVCNGEMSIGKVFAFLSYAAYISGPVDIFTKMPYIWANIKPSAQRLVDLLEIPYEVFSGIERKEKQEEKEGFLELENISFSYQKERVIFKDMNLIINKGEKIAIVGENGAGKTTLINLLLGLLSVQEGSIRIRGESIGETGLENWRNHFALIGQKPYLFQGTIKDNVDLKGEKTVEEIKMLAEKSGLEFMFDKWKDGVFYWIADNGCNLSGGERQKIAFLRALLKEAEILILDEATSNCDEESRRFLRKVVFEQSSEQTVILISHYPEDFVQADCVYEIKNYTLQKVSN